jgi:hypothetical protein
MAIAIDYQRISVEDVQSVVVSDIEADDEGLVYARLIQIYVDPPTDTTRRPIFELMLYGGDQTADKTALELTTPTLSY